MCCFNLSLALGDLRETTQQTQSPLSLPLPLLSHPSFFLCFAAIFFFFNRPADCRKLSLFRVWKVITETTQLNWTLSSILRAKLLPLPLPLAVLGCSFGGAIGLGAQQDVQLYLPALSEASSRLSPGCLLESLGLDGPDQEMRRKTWLDSAKCPCLTSALFLSPEERWCFPAHGT